MGADNEIIAVKVERQPDGRRTGGTDDCPLRTALGKMAVVAIDDEIRFGASREAVTGRWGAHPPHRRA